MTPRIAPPSPLALNRPMVALRHRDEFCRSFFLPSLRVKTLSRHQKQKLPGISVNPEHAAGIIEAIYRGKSCD
jgi:hypothetical protein